MCTAEITTLYYFTPKVNLIRLLNKFKLYHSTLQQNLRFKTRCKKLNNALKFVGKELSRTLNKLIRLNQTSSPKEKINFIQFSRYFSGSYLQYMDHPFLPSIQSLSVSLAAFPRRCRKRTQSETPPHTSTCSREDRSSALSRLAGDFLLARCAVASGDCLINFTSRK